MDFNKFDGFEFEEYIGSMFIKKGFEVQKTNYSHDGGIDLIAICDEPIFSGKYIVQCKKYEDTLVGQPAIRDLYGVVMSENANKGILITTSDFTQDARSFAENKNIELIDGVLLRKIFLEDNKNYSEAIDIKGFNGDRYQYLKDKIKTNHSEAKYYEETISFLKEYIISDAPFIEELKIFEKIIDLNQELIKRCYKKKSDMIFRKICWLRIAEIEMLRGNLGEAANILLDNNSFYIKSLIPRNTKKYSDLTFEPIKMTRVTDVETRNFYSILKELGLYEICSLILKKYSLEDEINSQKRFTTDSWYLQILNKSKNDFENFISPNISNDYIFSKPCYASYGKQAWISYPDESENISVDIKSIVSKYQKGIDDIKKEILFALKQHNIEC